jgi:toxin ParE1/3/4
MAEFRLTPAAERDLESIWSYTVQRWGIEQASRYTDILTSAFSELTLAPESAPACGHIRPGYRRRIVERHVIYFRVTAYGIAIVRILHHAMNAPRYL